MSRLSVWVLQPPNGPIVSAWSVGGLNSGRGKEVLGKKHAFVPQWPPKTPCG